MRTERRTKGSCHAYWAKLILFRVVFYGIQGFLQGMDQICSGYFEVAGGGRVRSRRPGRPGGQTWGSGSRRGSPPVSAHFHMYAAGFGGLPMGSKRFSCPWMGLWFCAAPWNRGFGKVTSCLRESREAFLRVRGWGSQGRGSEGCPSLAVTRFGSPWMTPAPLMTVELGWVQRHSLH